MTVEREPSRQRRWYLAHHEQELARSRAYDAANPERKRGWYLANREQILANHTRQRLETGDELRAVDRERYVRNQERVLANKRAHWARLKAEVFEAYGGFRCRCCGESHQIFLVIDHINDDGAAHRKELTGGKSHSVGRAFYRWLKLNGFPPGFQVLCHNCNWAKSRGGCPHLKEREEAA